MEGEQKQRARNLTNQVSAYGGKWIMGEPQQHADHVTPGKPRWGDSLPDERAQELRTCLWAWDPETMASEETPGPFAGQPLTGAEVFCLAATVVAGREADGAALATAEARLRAAAERPWTLPALAALHLAGADLRHARLVGASLGGAQLAGADLRYARLGGAELAGARLEGANLSGARLEEANLRGASLRGADLRAAQLGEANLRGADLEDANLSEAYFAGAFLFGARLNGTDLTQASLAGAHLMEAHLAGAHLIETDLVGADLSGAHLEGAQLRGAQLGGADLTRADLVRADCSAAQLVGTHLVEAQLAHADFGGARLVGADLTGAWLAGASLRAADLETATLTGAHLQEANLTGAHLEQARLMGAHLVGANLTSAWLAGADLRLASCDATTRLDAVSVCDVTHGAVRVADVRWGGVNLSVVDWTQLPQLGDEQAADAWRPEPGERSAQARGRGQRAAYLEAVRANRQLAVALQSQGISEEAAVYGYRAQVLQRTMSRLQRRWGRAAFSFLLDLLAGHGYHPGRSVAVYLILVLGFAEAYFEIGRVAGPTLSPVGALIMSIVSFHGRGFFPQTIRLDDPLMWLVAAEAIIGLFIEISFIATFTQRFFAR